MIRINLLEKEKIATVEDLRFKRNFSIFAGTILGIACFASLAIFLISVSLNSQLKNYKDLEDELKGKITEHSNVESYNEVLVQRMGLVKQIRSPVDYVSAITFLQKSITNGLVIQSLKLDSAGAVELGGQASDSNALIGFFDNILSSGGNLVRNVVLNNLIRTKDNIYTFSLAVRLKKI